MSVKMPTAELVAIGMQRADEAMRVRTGCGPARRGLLGRDGRCAGRVLEESHPILFSVIPAIVAIGVVVGGIVIMNIC